MEGLMNRLGSQLKCVHYAGRLFAHTVEYLCQLIICITVYRHMDKYCRYGQIGLDEWAVE